MRIAYAAIIISILVIASISVAFTPTAVAKKQKKIRATGTLVKTFPRCTDGTYDCRPSYTDVNAAGENLLIVERVVKIEFNGDLVGTAILSETRVRNIETQSATQTTFGTFTGTLDGSEKGSFSFLLITTADRRNFDSDVPGSLVQEGSMLVTPGSGMGVYGREGGLEGICGSGTFEQSYPWPDEPGNFPFRGTYDFEFRFGKDCKKLNLAE